MMIPTTSGRVPGLMEARVWPPRMTAVTENPSLGTRQLTANRRLQTAKKDSLCQNVQNGVNRAADVA